MFLLYGFRLRVQTGRLRNKTLEFSGKIEQFLLLEYLLFELYSGLFHNIITVYT